MFKIFLFMSVIGYSNASDMDEMIFNGVINTVKNTFTNFIKEPPNIEIISGKKSYWTYQQENTKLKTLLKKHNIDYHTIIKREMYQKEELKSGVLPSKKKLIIEHNVLIKLAQENNINININKIIKKEKSNNKEEEREKAKAKEELKKQMNF